jgi:hypothetical protein
MAKESRRSMSTPSTERLARLLLGQEALMQDVYAILEEEQKKDDVLLAIVRSSLGDRENRLQHADPSRIFSLEDIRRTCIRYRLRFLPTGRFKGKVPPQALIALRRAETLADAPLTGFRIMAPAKSFRLGDCDADPLLFVPLGNGQYYLVHRWGGEIKPLRAVLTWPLRGPWHLLCAILLFAAALAAVAPGWLIAVDPAAGWWGPHRFFVFLWAFLTTSAITAFGWMAFFGQFSAEAWNSRHFN